MSEREPDQQLAPVRQCPVCATGTREEDARFFPWCGMALGDTVTHQHGQTTLVRQRLGDRRETLMRLSCHWRRTHSSTISSPLREPNIS